MNVIIKNRGYHSLVVSALGLNASGFWFESSQRV